MGNMLQKYGWLTMNKDLIYFYSTDITYFSFVVLVFFLVMQMDLIYRLIINNPRLSYYDIIILLIVLI